MLEYYKWTLLIIGLWLIIPSLYISVSNNLASKLFFKIIPFLLGAWALFVVSKDFTLT